MWKKMWFVIKEHVLYIYKAPADALAADSHPLLGYNFDLDMEVRLKKSHRKSKLQVLENEFLQD